MKSKTVKVLVVPAVGALFLAMTALGTSAFATDTVTPTPSISPTDTSSSDEGDTSVIETATASPTDTSSSDEGGASVAVNDGSGDQATLDAQQSDNADVQSILGDLQVQISDGQGDDTQVDEVNNDNNAEDASFNQDITAANQAGESEDAAQLTESASIVTSVTAPEVAAMTADDTTAHDLITGTPTK